MNAKKNKPFTTFARLNQNAPILDSLLSLKPFQGAFILHQSPLITPNPYGCDPLVTGPIEPLRLRPTSHGVVACFGRRFGHL